MNVIFKNMELKFGSIVFAGSKPGLFRIKKLLDMAKNPQDNLKCIHVAGTNGKGSNCFTLASILQEAGYKTGLYTSPEIINFGERIKINGVMISNSKAEQILDFFEPFLKSKEFESDPITKFELMTAMAFKYFSDEKCDVVVLETGLGGSFDATNVIKKPLCSVITSVSRDHTQVLGNSIEKIANEKLGIIKPHCPIVLAPNMDKCVYNLAVKKANETKSGLHLAKIENIANIRYSLTEGTTFNFENCSYKTNLHGEHQINNLATVFEAVKAINSKIKVPKQAVIDGIHKAKVPCRLEVASKNPIIILDAAHNPQGAKSLKQFITNYLSGKKVVAVVGMLSDKDADTTMKILAPNFEKIFTVTPPSPRALSASALAKISKKYNKNTFAIGDIKIAIGKAASLTCNNLAIVVFGSFYIMKEAKLTIKNLN